MSSDTGNKTSDPSERSLARSAARLRNVVFGVTAIMLLLYLAARFGVHLGRARVAYGPEPIEPVAARLIDDVGVALLVVALGRLTQMLGRMAAGEMLTAGVIQRFRGFAFWLLLMASFSFLAPLVAVMASAQTYSGGRVALVVDFRDLITVAVTLLLFLLARLLERSRSVEAELREIV